MTDLTPLAFAALLVVAIWAIVRLSRPATHCRGCGSRLRTVHYIGGHSERTGKPIRGQYRICPKVPEGAGLDQWAIERDGYMRCNPAPPPPPDRG